MGYSNLGEMYNTNFELHNHGWSLTDLENMYPYERDVYIKLTKAAIESQAAHQ